MLPAQIGQKLITWLGLPSGTTPQEGGIKRSSSISLPWWSAVRGTLNLGLDRIEPLAAGHLPVVIAGSSWFGGNPSTYEVFQRGTL